MTSTDGGIQAGPWEWAWEAPVPREPSHSERTDQAVRDAIAARDPDRLRWAWTYWTDDARQVVMNARKAGVDVDVIAPALADLWRPLPDD